MGSTLVWGILAHGYNLTHKLSFHDDIQELFTPGATYLTGRWFLGVMAKIETILFGTSLFSLPLLNGLLGILLIGLSVCLWAKLYGLEGKGTLCLLPGVAVSIPAITDLMGFMFMVQYYGLAVFMTSIGVYLICRWQSLPWKKPWLPAFWLVIGTSVTMKAIGIYQGMLPLSCSLLVLDLLLEVRRTDRAAAGDGSGMAWGTFWKKALLYVVCIGVASVIYMICARVFCLLTGTTMSEYGGLSGAGSVGIMTYLGRLGSAYGTFFFPERAAIYNLYPASIWWMHKVLLILAVVTTVMVLRSLHRSGVLQTILLLVVFPLSMNLVFVMTDVIWIHALTLYSQIALFIYVCANVEKLQSCGKDCGKTTGACILTGATTCLVALMVLSFVRYSNVCYLKAEFLQAQATSYFDRLITRIQETEGYTDETPIVYLNAQDKQDATMTDMSGFEDVITVPFVYDTLINDYAWENYMKMWNGFSPVTAPGDPNPDNWPKEIQDMPRYPAAGSIRYIEEGHYMAVKF